MNPGFPPPRPQMMLVDAGRAKEILLDAITRIGREDPTPAAPPGGGAGSELEQWVDVLLSSLGQSVDAVAPPHHPPSRVVTSEAVGNSAGFGGGMTDSSLEGGRRAVRPGHSTLSPHDLASLSDQSFSVGWGDGDLEAYPAGSLPPGGADAAGRTAAYSRESGYESMPGRPTPGVRGTPADTPGPASIPATVALTAGPTPANAAKPRGSKSRLEVGAVVGGKYALVSVIGEGGMGRVYLARQSEPVRRDVALKLIKSGLDCRKALARFEAERQTLALMDHPNVARVYDGGASPDGSPFFVMELVRGVPITAYCDEHRLPLPARLDLFVQVCRAVQHAHQKGIIHRDLKPANILVTEVDGRPTPKVIDFGVARATELRPTGHTGSDVNAIVGTPAYMSPEQTDPSSADIDTRTDVYALGGVLYELLAGSPPIRTQDARGGSLLEMIRMVRDVEPPPPSARVRGESPSQAVSAARATDPGRLVAKLRGDLDCITMKALAKDREQRYESALGLATDVLRHQANEPVVARPPTRGYRLRKFARRNRSAVTAAVAVAELMAVCVAAIVVQWREAVFQRAQGDVARAEAESHYDIAMGQRAVALRAFAQMLDIARIDLPDLPGSNGVQKKILAIADEGLNGLDENPAAHARAKDATLAAAHASTARLHLQMEEFALAIDEFRRAESVYERVLLATPEGAERDPVRQNLAAVELAFAQALCQTNSSAKAHACLVRAAELLTELGPDVPPDVSHDLECRLRSIEAMIRGIEPAAGDP